MGCLLSLYTHPIIAERLSARHLIVKCLGLCMYVCMYVCHTSGNNVRNGSGLAP